MGVDEDPPVESSSDPYRYFRDVPGGTLIRHRQGEPYEELWPTGEWKLYPMQPPDEPRWEEEVDAEEALSILYPDYLPRDDVEACAADVELQAAYRQEKVTLEEALDAAQRDAQRHGSIGTPVWIYFSSPAWTWENLCGRAGWLLVDLGSGTQFAFLETVIN